MSRKNNCSRYWFIRILHWWWRFGHWLASSGTLIGCCPNCTLICRINNLEVISLVILMFDWNEFVILIMLLLYHVIIVRWRHWWCHTHWWRHHTHVRWLIWMFRHLIIHVRLLIIIDWMIRWNVGKIVIIFNITCFLSCHPIGRHLIGCWMDAGPAQADRCRSRFVNSKKILYKIIRVWIEDEKIRSL